METIKKVEQAIETAKVLGKKEYREETDLFKIVVKLK
jgi:hypothetical protein